MRIGNGDFKRFGYLRPVLDAGARRNSNRRQAVQSRLAGADDGRGPDNVPFLQKRTRSQDNFTTMTKPAPATARIQP
jgi:hypothetical protein